MPWLTSVMRSTEDYGTERESVPIRTFADWKEPAPGFLEVDLVAHCGESAAGSFANTLVLTDIASGWTECVALIVRESSLVVNALERLRETMPFPLRGIDTDTGASSSMRSCSRTARSRRSSSHARVLTGRMIKHGLSRRTEQSSGDWSATVASKALRQDTRLRVSTRRPGCS